MDTRALYTGLVALVMLERGLELVLSIRNGRRAFARGGIEVGAGHYPWMVAIHTLFLFACLAEVWLLGAKFVPALGIPMLVLLGATMALRYWAIVSLGERWNTRVVFVPGDSVICGGPYRWLRHPNYVAVVLELAALPLVHGAWRTAVLFSVANAVLLWVRIRVEEGALAAGCDYDQAFSDRHRFVPRGGGGSALE